MSITDKVRYVRITDKVQYIRITDKVRYTRNTDFVYNGHKTLVPTGTLYARFTVIKILHITNKAAHARCIETSNPVDLQ